MLVVEVGRSVTAAEEVQYVRVLQSSPSRPVDEKQRIVWRNTVSPLHLEMVKEGAACLGRA